MFRFAASAFVFTLTFGAPVSAQSVSDRDAYEIAKDAYVYAYPLF